MTYNALNNCNDRSSFTLEGVQDKLNLGSVFSPYTPKLEVYGDDFIHFYDDYEDKHIILYFVGKNYSHEVKLLMDSVLAGRLARYLMNNHVYNFDMCVRGRYLHEWSRISSGDTVEIIGGFGGYLSEQWNKIMHSLNGNIDDIRKEECLNNHGGHLPVDKTHQKTQTCKQEAYNRISQFANWIKETAQERNVWGRYVNSPDKIFADKVSYEGDVDHRIDVIDIGVPVEETKIEVKEEKKDPITSTNFDEWIGKEYEFDYVINGEYAPDYAWRRNRYYGIFPKFSFVPVASDHFIRYLPNFIFFVCILLNICIARFNTFNFFKKCIGEIVLMAILRMNIKGAHSEFYTYGSDWTQWAWGIYTRPILMFMLFRFLNGILGLFISNFMLSEIGRLLITYFFYLLLSKYKTTDFYYWPRLLFAVQPYYTRHVLITDIEVRKNDKNIDKRVQGQKTFEKTEDSHIATFEDTYTKTFPFGYYEDGNFVIVDRYIHEVKTVINKCELELVCQMFTTRNTCANVSTEALIERISSSTNLGPHINNFRSDHLNYDINNDSYRMASYIILTRRYENSRTIDAQLFWTGSSLGLMRTREL